MQYLCHFLQFIFFWKRPLIDGTGERRRAFDLLHDSGEICPTLNTNSIDVFSERHNDSPFTNFNSDFLNLPIDNSQKKNYNKTKKFGISELTIINRPP